MQSPWQLRSAGIHVANFIRGLRKTFQLFFFSVISVAESRSFILRFAFQNFFFFFNCSKISIIFFAKNEIMKFWDNCHNFYYLGEKNKSRRHLPYLSKLTSLFSKHMSKFRANNHFYLSSYFNLRFEKIISNTFAIKSIGFLN